LEEGLRKEKRGLLAALAILFGNSPKKKPCHAGAWLRALLFPPFAQASLARAENNKALMLRIKAFSL